tara:strand:- start:148155 stop:150167 length:2013 start_codon:yes stop_codon:yes gene_type:complete
MKSITADLQKPFESLKALYAHLSSLSDLEYLREHKIINYISEKVRVVGEVRRLADHTEDVRALNCYAELILNKAPYLPHDAAEAEHCLIRAAKQGSVKAQYNLVKLYSGAFAYDYDTDSRKDDIERYIAALNEADDDYAAYFLAQYYITHDQIEDGHAKLEQAVAANVPEALNFKAKAYMNGRLAGVEKDGKLAFSMFKRAYERCLVIGEDKLVEPDLKYEILYHLGCMYVNGWGVLINGYTGRCLILKAAERNEEARKYCETIMAEYEWYAPMKEEVKNLDVDSLFEGSSAATDFRKIIQTVHESASEYDMDIEVELKDNEPQDNGGFDPMSMFEGDNPNIKVYNYDADEDFFSHVHEGTPQFGGAERRAPKVRLQALNKDELDKIFAPLDDLVGLGHIKKEVRSIVNLVQLNAMRETQGLPKIPVSTHMVFSGPPGTGKTTVARLVGDILWEIGYLSSGHVVEVARQDLVGEYIGWTANMTSKALHAAKGGVFFLDEAYTLSNDDSGRDFGYEAIDAINKFMEDNREDTLVIVAGYKDEMGRFLASNPGLKSRFKHELDFKPMDAEQLYSVYKSFCKKYQMVLSEDADTLLEKVLKRADRQGEFHKSNARGVRDMFERMLVKQAERLAENFSDLSETDLVTIEKQDIYMPETFNDGNITYLPNKKKDD